MSELDALRVALRVWMQTPAGQDAFHRAAAAIIDGIGGGLRTMDDWRAAEFERRYKMQRQRKARKVRQGR